MENKKVRKHSLCEKNAVIAMILTVPLGLLTQLSGQPQGVVSALIVSALSLVLLIIYNKWFSPEFDGVFKAHVPVKEILMVSSAMAILIVCLALMAGISEETIFRAMLIPIGMRYLKVKNRAVAAVIISSVIFGPLHLTNIFVGADPVMTLIQAFMATCGGFVLAGIYLRTGSVIPGMIAHAVYDFINFVTDPTINEKGVVVSDSGNVGISYYVIILAVSVTLLVAGCYLIRKTKQDTIENIWKIKWSN